jgi:KUP system potassium uptake protein
MAQTYVAGHGQDKAADPNAADHHQQNFWSLTIGSIGVVYGDIGTSPLYAFK